MKQLPREDLLKIASSLENYHKIFYVFWELAGVYFTDEIPTAAIRFDKTGGKPQMLLNEEFWNRHGSLDRLFFICHECLHVLLDHDLRDGMLIPGATPLLVNKAQDIAINHMITYLFNYDRDDLSNWQQYCWIETCFTNPHLIRRNETFIYYLQELIKDPKSNDPNGPAVLDSHQDPAETTATEKKQRASIAADLANDLSPQELETLISALPKPDKESPLAGQAGTMRGMYEAMLEQKLKKLKLNFKLMVNKLKRTRVTYIEKDSDTFVRDNRRFTSILRRPDLSLPGTHVVQGTKKDRLLTVLFMDVSGSCMAYFKIFQQVADAFNAEQDTFDLRLFIFDTRVQEIVPGTPIRVGGGTCYKILEQKVLELEKEYHRYPDCVVVLTDGDGTQVKPKGASKWIWLLTPPATKTYIPIASKSWNVSQVEFG